MLKRRRGGEKKGVKSAEGAGDRSREKEERGGRAGGGALERGKRRCRQRKQSMRLTSYSRCMARWCFLDQKTNQ
jgi:hypothetical protein